MPTESFIILVLVNTGHSSDTLTTTDRGAIQRAQQHNTIVGCLSETRDEATRRNMRLSAGLLGGRLTT